VFESCSKYCIAVPLLVLYRLLVLGKSGCLLLRCFLKRITGFSLYHVFVSSMIFHSLPIWRFFTVIRKKKTAPKWNFSTSDGYELYFVSKKRPDNKNIARRRA
jgi:hypothetical protein